MALTGSLEVSYEVLATGTSGETEIQYEVSPTSTVGETEVAYEVLPAGIANLPSSGTVRQFAYLPTRGGITPSGETYVQYEVMERPKVTASLSPVQDAFVWDLNPTINYGDTGSMAVGRTSGGGLARGLIQFDLSILRPDLDIIDARLRLHLRFAGTGSLALHRVLQEWAELGVTWANQPGILPSVLAQVTVPPETPAVVELDVTPIVLGWYGGGVANRGLALRALDEALDQSSEYGAREAGPELAPELLVTYYEPDAIREGAVLPSSGSVQGVGVSSVVTLGETRSPVHVTDCARHVLVFAGCPLPPEYVGNPDVVVVPHRDLVYEKTCQCGEACQETPYDNQMGGCYEKVIDVVGTCRDIWNVLAFIRRVRVYHTWWEVYRFELGPCQLPCQGQVGRPGLPSQGLATQASSLPTEGNVHARTVEQLPSAGAGSRRDLPTSGRPGFREESDLPSSGTPRARGDANLPTSGRVQRAADDDLPTRGRVTPPHDDLATEGRVPARDDLPAIGQAVSPFQAADLPTMGRVRDYSDLPAGGTVAGEASDLPATGAVRALGQTDLPSTGHASSRWLAARATIRTPDDMPTRGTVPARSDLASSGSTFHRGASDLPTQGLPRIRAASDLPSQGIARGAQADLGSSGVVEAIVLELDIDLEAWPPEGRTTDPA